MLTKESDQVLSIGVTAGENTEGIRLAGVLATDLDGNSGSTRTCLDCMCGGKLDQIGNTDLGLGCDIGKVTAKALHTAVLFVRALVGEDERTVACAVEAVME